MNIKIQSVHFDADRKLIEYATEKVNKIGHFYEHVTDGEVIMRLEKSVTRDNKVAEIKLRIPGKTLFAEEKADSFEHALDKTVEALTKQVKKEKEKQRGL